jgi:uncharacterized protein (TIGR03086 family)
VSDTTSDLSLLEGVLEKLEGLLAGVRPDQRALPTPCKEWDVGALEGHLVGWLRYFAAKANREQPDPDPGATRAGADPAAEFHAAAEHLLQGLREQESGAVALAEGEMPPAMLRVLLTGEYVVHGWDLATATGQPVPFTDVEAEAALAMRSTLTPENRGTMFGPEVPVSPDAPALTRLIAFSGRQPS